MTKHNELHEKLLRDLAALKLSRIAEIYRDILDEGARKNSSALEVLSTLISEEATFRSDFRRGQHLGHRHDRPVDASRGGAGHPRR